MLPADLNYHLPTRLLDINYKEERKIRNLLVNVYWLDVY
jgi:hypothetical protein